jgi:hypothetical protein
MAGFHRTAIFQFHTTSFFRGMLLNIRQSNKTNKLYEAYLWLKLWFIIRSLMPFILVKGYFQLMSFSIRMKRSEAEMPDNS